MADCALLKGCAFFNDRMPDTYGVGAIYKKKYCLGDASICARYMVASTVGRDKVTLHLYPNMIDQAKQIIAQASPAGTTRVGTPHC